LAFPQAGHVFTKLIRCFVKKWRSIGIQILVILDDGFGTEDKFGVALLHSSYVYKELIDSGLVPNMKKSIWIPEQIIKWLGFLFNFMVVYKYQIRNW
jgi:hypothetical protein